MASEICQWIQARETHRWRSAGDFSKVTGAKPIEFDRPVYDGKAALYHFVILFED